MNKILVISLVFLSLTISGELGYYYYLQKYVVKKQIVQSPTVVSQNNQISPTPIQVVHTTSFNTNYYSGKIIDMDVDNRVLEWDFEYKIRFKLQQGKDIKPLFITKYVLPNITVKKMVGGQLISATLSDIHVGDEVVVMTKADNLNPNYATNMLDVQITKKSSSLSGQLSQQPIQIIPTKYISRQTVIDTEVSSSPLATITPIPTSDMVWTAHSDYKNTYVFKYPSNVEVIDANEIGLRYLGVKQPPGDPIDGWVMTFSQPFSLSQSGLKDIKQYIDKDIAKALDANAEITKETVETMINGMNAYIYVSKGSGITRHMYIQSPYDKDLYVAIGTLVVDPKNKGYENIVDATLATFSFLH